MFRFPNNRRVFRRDFSRIKKVIDIPNLLEIQQKSFDSFLQADVEPEKRTNTGLQGVFESVFPIKNFTGTASLEFVKYSFGKPKYGVKECHQRGLTYAFPLKVTIRLVVWDKDEDIGLQTIRDVKEQEVYFGDMPLMTGNGSFVINGTERVIVSQLHRSPGVFFEYDKAKLSSEGRHYYSARIIPYRGSWIDFEFDLKGIVYVKIDRRRKLPATVLLKALGYSKEDLLNFFYHKERIFVGDRKAFRNIVPAILVGRRTVKDIKDPKTGEVIVKKGRKVTRTAIKKLEDLNIEKIPVDIEDVVGRFVAGDIVDPGTGEVILECNDELTKEKLEECCDKGIREFDLLFIDSLTAQPYLRNTLISDQTGSKEEALKEIYKRLRPGDPSTLDSAETFFRQLFFNPERYDLSNVGRMKLNRKLSLDVPLDNTVLTKEDILKTVKYLVDMMSGIGTVDDIDHLGNRRIRRVGELMENQYRVGLVRMERAVKERLTLQDIDALMPHDLVNPKPVSAAMKEFFGSSQLSQFMDQTNPLSEITHKRRLSALGPGGLTRERAGFEVRDVHATHYGRICPIETPEGPNIGLIVSLSTYARVNEFGFIETPYRKVKDGRVTDEMAYFSALDEEDFIIAQANAPVDSKGKFTGKFVSSRKGGEFVMPAPEDVDLMDVSPSQLVSVAAALIPFLENDDANRALMGSNMQRQAVPLLSTDSPMVGTGMEAVVAKDSGVAVLTKRDGVVEDVDSSRIVVRCDENKSDGTPWFGMDIYNLIKFKRSNQNTCINQKPLVRKGDRVVKGEIIADGPCTSKGELALGRNVVVAFMPWGGYNFEDSILISEKLVKEDTFTSLHIEEFETLARDTKLGKEEITIDIPNVGEEALSNLDESGIIRIGAEVKSGDILIGKITPKGETQLSPEEKLLRAIFGEKAGDVKDTSLRVPPGVEGVVIDATVFSRKKLDNEDRLHSIEDKEISRLLKDKEDELRILKAGVYERVKKLLIGCKSTCRIVDDKKDKTVLTMNKVITEKILLEIPRSKWKDISIDDENVENAVGSLLDNLSDQIDLIGVVFDNRINKLKKGDEIPPGVIKMVKVYIAMKRKLSVGDKMAGRHGNKGVVSKILPQEDMPYLEDGTPVDIVLNPLGVPSRMNVGQILETHLGWTAKTLGKKIEEFVEKKVGPSRIRDFIKGIYSDEKFSKFLDSLNNEEVSILADNLKKGVYMATPVFDGASEADIKNSFKKAGLPVSGKTILYDGRTGEPFDCEVTVGVMYMLKLHHLVDDKIHARSTGPYSLVTQQPLGGKAQFGGQRLGEMEVWALEAYGASYTLQEFLTVKSDDVAGRTRMYEAIVKGNHTLEPSLPESFNVLVKELQGLALDIELLEKPL
ncbi:MAG: DNA-directed RNA polymerase subunit beta [Thermodesulfobacteriota bacterium]